MRGCSAQFVMSVIRRWALASLWDGGTAVFGRKSFEELGRCVWREEIKKSAFDSFRPVH